MDKVKAKAEAKNLRVGQKDVGRFVRVVWDDTGARDGILVSVDGPRDFRFLPFGENDDVHNNGAPVILIGKRVQAWMFLD